MRQWSDENYSQRLMSKKALKLLRQASKFYPIEETPLTQQTILRITGELTELRTNYEPFNNFSEAKKLYDQSLAIVQAEGLDDSPDLIALRSVLVYGITTLPMVIVQKIYSLPTNI